MDINWRKRNCNSWIHNLQYIQIIGVNMELVINDIMTILEITNIQYLVVFIGILFGILVLIKLWK